ncbi:MAG: oligosaccharide flippase family protein [Candidatus Staskawiczbacteria bacterium]|nr:oligosaccharide flippase family protein [Candidatus Staskawiczbacteria bacterium]MBI3337247.1 oligosaccharide flippase family protein [Candidatus Staskawiczbacteria bacterium]
MSRKRTISSNIKYNIINYGISFAVGLVLFPFIVSHVGKEVYGAYLLVMTFIGYFGVLDFGIGTAVVKYIAEFMGRGDKEGTSKIINSSLFFYIIVGLISAVTLLILSFYFDRIFNIGTANVAIMRQLFWVAAIASLFIWPGRTFDGVLYGLQRFDWLAINNIAITILTAISAYFIFLNNFGMVWFLALSYFLIIARYIISYIILRHRILKIHIFSPHFDKETSKKIFSFSFFVFLSSLLSLLIFNFDSFVIGTFASVSAVTLYGVGYSLQNGFRAVNSLIGGPLFSASASLEGKNEQGKQKELLFKGTKYMTMIFAPAVIITIIFAELFITNWMGPGFAESILPAQFLIAFWLFNGTIQVGSGLATAKGHVKVFFKISFLNALLNVGLSLALVKPLGILGVVLGTTIPMILIDFPLSLYQILKIMKVSFKDFFNLAIKKNIGLYFFTIILSGLSLKVFQPSNVFLTIVQMGAVYAVVIAFGFYLFLSFEERKEILFMIKL